MSKPYDKLIYELASRGLNNYQISDLVNVDEATVRRALKRTGYEKHLLGVTPSLYDFQLEKPIVLTDEDAMITADWHAPLFNPHLVNEMILKAIELNIKTLVIGGDFWNGDAVSQYEPKQDSAGLDKEHEISRIALRTLAEWFDRIIIIWGNHDARYHKALGYKTTFARAMRMLFGDLGEVNEKIEISNLDHMLLKFTYTEPHRQVWRVCHPQNYSRIPLSTPRAMVSKYRTNVICAHAHHAAVGYGPDGSLMAVEIGGLFNQEATAYLQRSTTFPTWTPGFGWFKDGGFTMKTPHWTMS